MGFLKCRVDTGHKKTSKTKKMPETAKGKENLGGSTVITRIFKKLYTKPSHMNKKITRFAIHQPFIDEQQRKCPPLLATGAFVKSLFIESSERRRLLLLLDSFAKYL